MDVTTVLRVAFSLAVVMGLLWLSYRVADRSRRTAPGGRGAQLTVVARQGLSQKSAAVLLDSGGTRYLLGVTESSVTVIDQGPAPVTTAAVVPASPKHAVRDVAGARTGPFNVVKSTTGQQSVADPLGGAEVAPAAGVVQAAAVGQVDADGPAERVRRADPAGPGPTFDEAVLAAQVWLDEAPVPRAAAPTLVTTTTGGPAGTAGMVPAVPAFARVAAPSGVGSDVLDPTTVRSLLAVDTWRQAARAVWGPRR
ncbi:FliO/MopB family protein [Oerskovia jenensis]|uniref:Flagellar biogenesis protein FliO n=1 Tax=Oerskovia jenensis TaxID=162169 RepID=A0ABS2LEB2_9CELL|nr:flagellar biosynthetic protein FliO [Oerskovia jenensis]MBM7478458.1 flagellar biogenesis protein FliO [Oerskovia jenensis]